MMTRRILLVEDDPVSLKLMRDLLQAHGYQTFEVTDGARVMERAKEVRPHLVVMDIGLPRQDGVEATRSLKALVNDRRIAVLAVTAYAMPADEQRMREAGCDAYLTKPLWFGQFLDVVRELAHLDPRND